MDDLDFDCEPDPRWICQECGYVSRSMPIPAVMPKKGKTCPCCKSKESFIPHGV